MILPKEWSLVPEELHNKIVKEYFEKLNTKRSRLYVKRFWDIVLAGVLLVVLTPIFLLIALWVKLDSEGPVFYRQKRITSLGREFRIYKFRTMVEHADIMGSLVTVDNDKRITKAGGVLRKYRLDEIPQLLNIIKGEMTFVGTRPEVQKYVNQYTDEMKATLLLPAGVTSLASINYKDEDRLLSIADNVDRTYVAEILPEKMRYNLAYLDDFSNIGDFKLMLKTVVAVLK